MEWGQHLSTLERRVARGLPTPAMERRPILDESLTLPWKAFHDLHCTRFVGFGPSPINITDILSWLILHGIQGLEERLDYFNFITAMDAVWLEYVNKKQKDANPRTRS